MSDILPAWLLRVLIKPPSRYTQGSSRNAHWLAFDDAIQQPDKKIFLWLFLWTRDGRIAMLASSARAPQDWRRDLICPTKRQRLYHPTRDAYWGRFGCKLTLPTLLAVLHCPHRSTARLTPHWYPTDPTSRSITSVKHLEDAAIVPVSGPSTLSVDRQTKMARLEETIKGLNDPLWPWRTPRNWVDKYESLLLD